MPYTLFSLLALALTSAVSGASAGAMAPSALNFGVMSGAQGTISNNTGSLQREGVFINPEIDTPFG